MSNDWFNSSGTASASSYPNGYSFKLKGRIGEPRPAGKAVESDINFKEIATELKKIADEEEEDKQKHLPVFDPEDLDI